MVSKYEAVAIAAQHIEAAGFVYESGSNQSEAVYFRLPGRVGNLRVAAHSCRHPFEIVTCLTFEYRDANQRDEENIYLCAEEIVAMADEAMATYRSEAEIDDADDDDYLEA